MLDKKSIEGTKVSQFRSGLHPCINIRHSLVKGEQTLVLPGGGINGSIDTFSNLSWILGEIGSGSVLEPVPK